MKAKFNFKKSYHSGWLTNEITCVKTLTTSYSVFQIYIHKTTQSRLSAVATAQAGNHATHFSRQVDCGLGVVLTPILLLHFVKK